MEIININSVLVLVGAVSALLLTIGFTVFVSDSDSVTHKAFLALTISSIVWSLLNNYAIYQSSDPVIVLWLLRIMMFVAVWFAFSFFTFFYVFPSRHHKFPSWYRYFLVPATVAVSLLTLTPLVFRYVTVFSSTGQVQQVSNGPGIFVFGIMAFVLDFGAIIAFLRKTLRARGKLHDAYWLTFLGTVTTILLIITFSFIFPAFLGDPSLVPYGSIFLLPFIGLTAYAIHHGNILNVKEITMALLVSVLAVIMLIEIIFTQDLKLVLLQTIVFSLVLIVGMFLIRGVVREVKQREKIQKLAQDLKENNNRQEALIHFISHEVKGYLAKDMSVFSNLIEGDMGKLSDEAKPFLVEALKQSRTGAHSVMRILQASNLKNGRVTYHMEKIDFADIVKRVFENMQKTAKAKDLRFVLDIKKTDEPYTVFGDSLKLSEDVLRNIIENSINYTPAGSITVSLNKNAKGNIVFSVQDTGVGVTNEDKKHLFTEGGHGKNSIKLNAHSTGYGLFIVKQIVTAHKGRVYVKSKGEGKGADFGIELPPV